ncbi:hypothetical protein [Fredinandcohnia sp. FSL W7-1320]|uniref:hypothetical protein n=1 Tax=Fredinandcohnia sp. FSL W7-1320 TaxID=2954540 RepID=UPI0030FDBFE7
MTYIKTVLPRKLLTASISGSLFAILFGLFFPGSFGSEINSIKEYMWSFSATVPFYLMYSFPVILVYGTVTSVISDFLSGLITKNRLKRMEPYLSAVFHFLFGFVLQWISLVAAILFFVTDRILGKKKNRYTWSHGLKSLIIPFLIWILFMGIIWIMDFIRDGGDHIVY